MADPYLAEPASSELFGELVDAGFDDATEIGRGEFGIVARCHQQSLGRIVAVKVLTGKLSDDDIEGFFREQRAVGRLSGHPHVVEILAIGTTDTSRPYLVMPYCPDGSLELRVLRDGPLSWSEATSVGVKIAGSLESAHRLGIIHRDVKPTNILLTKYGDPQLSDFGISSVAGGPKTSDGRVTGSPAFNAPEILEGAQPTPASDVYGLGATLFAAMAGCVPFERHLDESVVEQFFRISSSKEVTIDEDRMPNDLLACIERATARDPCERYKSAMSFGNSLRDVEARHKCGIDEMIYPQDLRDNDTLQNQTQAAVVRPTTSPAEISAATNPRSDIASSAGKSARRHGNLPADITTFIGRRKEIAIVKKRLSTSRLVTLTGIGGVGKTRLALRVGATVRRAFADGVWFVELGEIEDSAFIGSAVSSSLGLRNHAAIAPTSKLVRYLADKQLLLIFDNCEHQLVPVSELTQSILQRCPGVRILATSRASLGMTGESTIAVPSMSLPRKTLGSKNFDLQLSEAVALFCDRASAVIPGFEITDENGPTVAELCRHLDGLPLAIELAAVRLRSLSIYQVLDRLTDRFQLLTAGSRVAPPRQQTLRLCIDWSYELCTTLEQQAWARLGVFSGGFELDAAEAICCTDSLTAEGLLDVISSLVDMSILIREEQDRTVRYHLLETLRTYGKEKLKNLDEYQTLRRRHRRWYEQLVMNAETDWFSERQLSTISRLERERPNLREALQFGLEGSKSSHSTGDRTADADADEGTMLMVARLFPFWLSRGHLDEGRTWLDRVLAGTDPHSTSIARLRLLYVTTAMAGMQGDTSGAIKLLASARLLCEEIGDSSLSDIGEWAAGAVALYSGEIDSAIISFDRAILEVGNTRLHFAHTGSFVGLSLAHLIKGQSSDALHDYERLLELTSGYNEHVHLGRCSAAGGWALWNLGQPERAISVLRKGLELSKAADDPMASARCVQVLAWIEADLHHEKRAATLLGAADMLWRDVVGALPDFLRQLPYQNKCKERTLGSLGKREFTTCFNRGFQLNFDQVVTYVAGNPIPSNIATDEQPRASLTKREQQVAALVARGLSNKEVATALVVSPRTAQGHVENILVKLGFHSRAQIAVWHTAHT